MRRPRCIPFVDRLCHGSHLRPVCASQLSVSGSAGVRGALPLGRLTSHALWRVAAATGVAPPTVHRRPDRALHTEIS